MGFGDGGPLIVYSSVVDNTTGDGQRILVNITVDTAAQPIQIVVNWTSDLPQ